MACVFKNTEILHSLVSCGIEEAFRENAGRPLEDAGRFGAIRLNSRFGV